MGYLHTLRWVTGHPLTHAKPVSAISRYIRWQFGSRILKQKVIYPWVNDTRLVVGLGDTGLTGNIYCGLHEFEDMSFILHALRATDCFVDVGANCGSYTVLAAGAVGCRTISIEPVPNTFTRLLDNVYLNRIETNVKCLNIGVGANDANLKFSSDLDTVNHVLTEQESTQECIIVPMKSLNSQLTASGRMIIKIDVEGYETNVIRGASEVMKSENVDAVVMELNGSGLRYGFDDDALHKSMLYFGFVPCRYSPLERKMEQLSGINRSGGNTIYVKNFEFVEQRVKSAAAFEILGRQI